MKLEHAIRRAPLVPVGVAAMTGIGVADAGSFTGLALTLLAGGLLSAFLFRRKRPLAPILLASLLAFAVFAFQHHARLAEIAAFPFANSLSKGESLDISGSGWIADRVNEGERSASTKLHLETLSVRGVEIACDHRVPVWIQRTDPGLRYGQRVRFTGLIRPLESARAPGGFDPAAFYFRESGSLARLEIREGDEWERLAGNRGSRLVRFSQGLRDRLEEGLFTGLPLEKHPYARLIAAMALGAREDTPEDLEESFRRSGTMHLFAVSGLHVGVVAGLFFGGLILCRVPRRTAVLIVIPLILFYAVLTGLRPSAIRAALMLSVVMASLAVKEKPRLLNSLALAALLILGFDTQQLFLPGFQLSFAVLLFLALFTRPLQRRLSLPWLTDPFIPKTLRGPLRRTKDHFVTGLATALAVSVVSWMGSLGLLVWHFQSFAPVGVLANVFMVPLASLVVSLAVASLLCFSVHGLWLSGWINHLNVALTVLLTSLAQFFGGLPGAYQNSGGFDRLPTIRPDTLTLDVMGERGGSAMLLQFPETGAPRTSLWMIDPGGTETYQRQLLPLLRTRAVNRLDGLVLTHGDIDHLGAAPTVLSQFRPELLIESAAENRSSLYPEIDRLADELGIERLTVLPGQRVSPHPDVSLHILAPDPADPGRIADDRALVMMLRYGERRILLSSDAGFETEKRLLENGVDLSADIWIRGQHVEAPSGLSSFVEAVDPEVVISTSAEFPAHQRIPDSLRTQLGDRGSRLIELDRAGVVTLSVRPGEVVIESFARPGDRIVLEKLKNSKK